MTKPKKPKSNSSQKAPKAHKAEAPFAKGRKSISEADRRGSKSQGTNSDSQKAGKQDRQSHVGARISRRAADRLRTGHLWVYSSDIEFIEAGQGEAPALVPVADGRGLLLGTALYSPSSQIALRMVSREAIDENEWLKLLEARLRVAVARRKPLLDEETERMQTLFQRSRRTAWLGCRQIRRSDHSATSHEGSRHQRRARGLRTGSARRVEACGDCGTARSSDART